MNGGLIGLIISSRLGLGLLTCIVVEASSKSTVLIHDYQRPSFLHLPCVGNMHSFSQSSHHIPCFLAEGTVANLFPVFTCRQFCDV